MLLRMRPETSRLVWSWPRALFAPFVAILFSAPASGQSTTHPVLRNIGVTCQWQVACMEKQQSAMRNALLFVSRKSPPAWKVQTCNRNASRRKLRVDWVGFNNCIRNPNLRPVARTRRR